MLLVFMLNALYALMYLSLIIHNMVGIWLPPICRRENWGSEILRYRPWSPNSYMRLQFQAKYHWLQSSCLLLPQAIMFCLATNYSNFLHSLHYFATSLLPKKKLWVKKKILMFTSVQVSLVYIVRRWIAGSYGSASKESVCSAGDLGSIPGLGRSPGEGKGYPHQYSGLENSMESIVQGVAKSRTRLTDFHFTSRYAFSSVQSLSRVRLFATPWPAARQASLSITSSWSFLKLMFIESVMPSNHLILCHPLPLPPSIFPSIKGLF